MTNAILTIQAILLLFILIVMIFGIIDFAPDNRVAVEIYRSDETGEMIYCETGDLSGSAGHTYMGSGKIDADKAVAC